jgi:hypothetical protein
MRLTFLTFLLCLITAYGFAAGPDKPAVPATPGATEQNTVQNKDDKAADVKWIDVDGATRRAIVTSWLELDEAIRPPFPSYFAQWMKNGAQPAAPAKPPSDTSAPQAAQSAADQNNKPAKPGETAPPAR